MDKLRAALQTLFDVGVIGNLSDGQLLERFVARGEEAVFEALIERHGPMVWGVCRRVLRDHHDAEDAFQATFLVFARKAASIVPREKVGNWLYGAAYRTVRKARVIRARRQRREVYVDDIPGRCTGAAEPVSDLLSRLDEELCRLPDKYRLPIVLCDLGGRTHKEAAEELGWPIGTVSGRLSRARALLARRLARRGVAATAGAMELLLAAEPASAHVPVPLIHLTAQGASRLLAVSSGRLGAITRALTWVIERLTGHAAARAAAERGATASLPPGVARLTEGVLKAMFVSTICKSAAAIFLVVSLGLAAAGLLNRLQAADPPQSAEGAAAGSPSGTVLPAVVVIRKHATSPVFSELPADLGGKIRSIAGVRDVAPELWKIAPDVEGQGMLPTLAAGTAAAASFDPPVICGQEIEPHLPLRIAPLRDALREGRFFEAQDRNQPRVVISRRMACAYPRDSRPRRVGDPLQIGGQSFQIIGIYETGTLLDAAIVMDINTARTLLKIPVERVSSYHVETADGTTNERVATALEQAIPDIDALRYLTGVPSLPAPAAADRPPGALAPPKPPAVSSTTADTPGATAAANADTETVPITVSGRATDLAGKPVAGATIHLVSTNGINADLGTTTSAPDGSYSFRDARLPVRQASPGIPEQSTFQVFGSAPGHGFAWHGMRFYQPEPRPAHPEAATLCQGSSTRGLRDVSRRAAGHGPGVPTRQDTPRPHTGRRGEAGRRSPRSSRARRLPRHRGEGAARQFPRVPVHRAGGRIDDGANGR